MKTTSIGIQIDNGIAKLSVWAPLATTVVCHIVDLDHDILMFAQPYGYWYAETDQVTAGYRYHFVVDGRALPDPASRAQPDGVHGDSLVVDLTFDWTDQAYQAPALRDWIIYELHVGTFSPSADFAGVIARLPYLKQLGINAIELMPVAQFPGHRNWGYDGVFAFAVQHNYGGARGLQKLIDACHRHQIAVILDVVYNHIGPEGNYLQAYGPYFTAKYQTPWGEALNYDDAWNHGTRNLVLQNVCMWFRDFHIDALRLDAVHAIKDNSPVHLLQDIRKITDEIQQATGRSHQLIVECDLNDRRFLDPLEQRGFEMDDQWVDEFHHALRVAAGEAPVGYYSDFNGVDSLAKAYEKVFVYDGNFSEHRKQFFGSSANGIAGHRFVVFSQNHDQIGNRMLGERSSMLYSPDLQRLMAMAVFISPFTPLLFMGEEWAATSPFLYFVQHGDAKLIQAVREGRRQEFAAFQGEGEVPDPQAEETYRTSFLDWGERKHASHAQMLAYYTALIALRRQHSVLKNNLREGLTVTTLPEKQSIIIKLSFADKHLCCFLNFSDKEQLFKDRLSGSWTKIWDTQDPAWGGHVTVAIHEDHAVHISAQSGAIFEKQVK